MPPRTSRRRKEAPAAVNPTSEPAKKRQKTAAAAATPKPSKPTPQQEKPVLKPAKPTPKLAKPTSEAKLPEQRRSTPGIVLTVGQGEVGQLGLGPDIMERKRFSAVPNLKDVVEIDVGGMHTVCLTSDGTVYTFGCDDDGALGRSATDENSFTPLPVVLDGPAVKISAGDSHSAALLPDGRVFAWGSFRDSHGPMGLTSTGAARKPTLVSLHEPVVRLASGSDHLLMLTGSGQIYSCGCPEQGQLGRVTARSAKRDSRGGLNALLVPQPIKFRAKVLFTNIWASTYGTFALAENKKIFVFGLNNYHQLGLDVEEPIFIPKISNQLKGGDHEWVKVAGGEHHTLLLDSDGKVFCMGRKEYGRLGLGNVDKDAEVPTVIPKLANLKCVDIACGSSVSYAVTEEGDCYAWGMGTNGQLGRGDDEDDVLEPELVKGKQLEGRKVIQVAAGGQHAVTLAVTK